MHKKLAGQFIISARPLQYVRVSRRGCQLLDVVLSKKCACILVKCRVFVHFSIIWCILLCRGFVVIIFN